MWKARTKSEAAKVLRAVSVYGIAVLEDLDRVTSTHPKQPLLRRHRPAKAH